MNKKSLVLSLNLFLLTILCAVIVYLSMKYVGGHTIRLLIVTVIGIPIGVLTGQALKNYYTSA